MRAPTVLAMTLLCWSAACAQSSGSAGMSDACYKDPTQASCSSFMRPEADVLADLTMICIKDPNLAGCALWGECKNGTAGGPLCEPFSLVGTLCTDASSTAGCEAWEALCTPQGTKAPQCSCYPPAPNMITTAAAKQAMLDLCGTHYMRQCDTCGGDGSAGSACSDPLPAVSSACQDMPNMYECQAFWATCNQEALYTAFPRICSETGRVPDGWKPPATPACTVASSPAPAPAKSPTGAATPSPSPVPAPAKSPAASTAPPSSPSPTPSPARSPSPSPSSSSSPSTMAAPASSPSPTMGVSSSPAPSSGGFGNGTCANSQWGTPSRNMADPCYSDPTKDSCVGFTRSDDDIMDDICKLCHDMDFMIGCTFWHACEEGKASGDHCKPASLLANLCVDMPGMKGCEAHNALCPSSSKVAQCTSQSAIPGVLTTFKTRDIIQGPGMCGSHFMVGCNDCLGDKWPQCPDPLSTIAKLCWGMPSMSDCQPFFNMCDAEGMAAGFPSICSGDEVTEGIPPMKMYLHQSWTDIVLTLHWIPRTKGAMVATWFACFFSAIFVQALKTWRMLVEAKWARERVVPHRAAFKQLPGMPGNSSDGSFLNGGGSGDGTDLKQHPSSFCGRWQLRLFNRRLMTREEFYRNCIRCLFTTFIVFIDYMLMLIVMTFNVAIITFTCVGFGVGALLFGHAGERPIASCGGPVADNSSLSNGGPEMPTADQVEAQFVDNGGCCGGKHV